MKAPKPALSPLDATPALAVSVGAAAPPEPSVRPAEADPVLDSVAPVPEEEEEEADVEVAPAAVPPKSTRLVGSGHTSELRSATTSLLYRSGPHVLR